MRFLLLFLLISCASNKEQTSSRFPLPKNAKMIFSMEDSSGTYNIKRTNFFDPKKQQFAVRNEFYPSNLGRKGKIVEKTINLYKLGKLKKDGKETYALRPELSQHQVWFEGKEYANQFKLFPKHRSLRVTLTSPDEKWQGSKFYNVPQERGIYCFYSSLVECLEATGFITRSIKAGGGEKAFSIIWDSYPYGAEQYVRLPKQVFSKAQIRYDKPHQGHHRFVLEFQKQVQFYLVNDEGHFQKMFWVAQGLTVQRK